MPPFCSGPGCSAPLTLEHSQSCSKGGSWIIRHDTVKHALAACARLATSTAPGDVTVQVEKPIELQASRPNAASTNNQQAANGKDARLDVHIRNLNVGSEVKTYSVDVRVTHLDCRSYSRLGKATDELLRRQAKSKCDKYEATVNARRWFFNPFVVTTCGILSPPAECLLKELAAQYASKRNMSVSMATALMRAQIGIAIIKGTSWGLYCDKSDQAKVAGRIRREQQDRGPSEAEIRGLFSDGGASQLPS